MNAIRILIVDDHSIMRMGLVSLLNDQPGIETVGEAGDGETAIALARKLKPDIILMDLMMPGMDGVEATRRILADNPSAKILLLTTFGSADGIAHALDLGAKGARMKSDEFSDLIKAIRTVAKGGRSVSPEIEQIISVDPPVPQLTERQNDILHAVTKGLTNEDIACQLDISIPMVKEHLRTLFSRIGAANRAEAVAIALRKHLLKI